MMGLGSKGTEYERELKRILSGDEKTVERIARKLDEEEAENYRSVLRRPFMVLRSAGSLGVDLIAMRYDFTFPIEVKSTSTGEVRFSMSSGRQQEQAIAFLSECERVGIVPIYALRMKRARGDPWRVYTLPIQGLVGRQRLIHRVLPKIYTTAKGNYILRWEDGMPLNAFLGYVNLREEEGEE